MDENSPYALEVPRGQPSEPGIGKYIARFFMIISVIGLIIVSLPFVICGGGGLWSGNPLLILLGVLFIIIPIAIIYFAIKGIKKLW